MVTAKVIWFKLDFHRVATAESPSEGRLSLTAVDVVTEGLAFEADFDQLVALMSEMEQMTSFFNQSKLQMWRPSCIDRSRRPPPSVQVSPTALFPLLPVDSQIKLDKQPRSAEWRRAMWRYAARCVLIKGRHGDDHRVRLFRKPQLSYYDEHRQRNAQRDRYMDLYTRNLSPAALELVFRGRAALLAALRGTKPTSDSAHRRTQSPFSIPDTPPLSLEEQWELSDLVLKLSVYDQRVYRAMAENTIRQEHAKRSTPPSPTRNLTWPLAPPSPTSGNRSPAHSPTAGRPGTLLPADFPPGFVANHHRITRSATTGAILSGETRQLLESPSTSPTLARVHAASSAALLGHTSPKAAASHDHGRKVPASPPRSPVSKHTWFQQTFLPKWLATRNLPLVNWSLNGISVALYRPRSSHVPVVPAPTSFAHSMAALDEPEVVDHDKRSTGRDADKDGREMLIEVRIDGCSGTLLLCKSPILRLLVELRLGLLHVTLLEERRASFRNVNSASYISRRRNLVSTDYIRDPADGFFYVGLKYNAKEAPASPSLLGMDAEQWDLKGRVCVGTINIEYDELALQKALGETGQRQSRTLRTSALTCCTIKSCSPCIMPLTLIVQRVFKTEPRVTCPSSETCIRTGRSSFSTSSASRAHRREVFSSMKSASTVPCPWMPALILPEALQPRSTSRRLSPNGVRPSERGPSRRPGSRGS